MIADYFPEESPHMPRMRRRIKSKCCYEICFRAREGLPLVAYQTMALIIGSAIARTQRDDKVILCHDIWNGSHAHIILVTQDSEQCTRFYGELQKRITDAIKRLLGLKYLDLWEGRPMVAEIADLDAAVERISYLYANPAQDDLEDRIDKFPGYSSWPHFKQTPPELAAKPVQELPWIRLPSIPQIPDKALSPEEDLALVRQLWASNGERHVLARMPNAWMSCFGLEGSKDIETVNQRIVARIQEREIEARKIREQTGKKVMGARKLLSQKIMKEHRPKKKDIKIFIISSIKELRTQLISEFQKFCRDCAECLRRWRLGDFGITWPPGAFKPPLPPLLNLLPS